MIRDIIKNNTTNIEKESLDHKLDQQTESKAEQQAFVNKLLAERQKIGK